MSTCRPLQANCVRRVRREKRKKQGGGGGGIGHAIGRFALSTGGLTALGLPEPDLGRCAIGVL